MADEIVYDGALATGCLPQPPDTLAGSGLAAFSGPQIPRDQWRTADAMRQFVPRGKCQKWVPGCNWWTTGKAYQTKYGIQTGKPYPEVSYAANYAEDTGNNFRVGTMPLDAIKAIAARGLLPASAELPEFFDRPTRVPNSAHAARKTLRADEWEQCHTAEDVVSALLNMDPVNPGFDWWDSDANPGPTGYLPVQGRGGMGGHSVLLCGVVMGYALSPSGVGILFNNHHGDSRTPATVDERGRTLRFPSWGDDGFGVVPIERVVAGIGRYGCWALRSVYVRDQDIADVPTPKFADAA